MLRRGRACAGNVCLQHVLDRASLWNWSWQGCGGGSPGAGPYLELEGTSPVSPCHILPCGDGWREKLPPPGLAPVITNGLSAAHTVGREITVCPGLMDELWWLLVAPRKAVPIIAGPGLPELLSSECAVEGKPGVGHSGVTETSSRESVIGGPARALCLPLTILLCVPADGQSCHYLPCRARSMLLFLLAETIPGKDPE